MPKRSAAALLAEIDGLPYGERMALLAGRADRPELVAELGAGNRFERATAILLATVAQDRDALRRALADEDADLRAAAQGALLRIGDPPDLRDAPAVTRAAAYCALRKGGPAEVADRLVDDVRATFGDREAARLLPACGDATVRRLLPGIGYAVGSWRALGERHPGPVLADAARQLAALPPPAQEAWWRRYGSGVGAGAPLELLDLLERFAPATWLPLPLTAYGRLVAVAPDRVLALLVDPGRTRWLLRTGLPRAVLSRLGRLEPDQLTALARRLRESDVLLAALLRSVPPRHRAAVHDAAVAGTDRTRALPADVLLDVLPRARRAAEADRILALPLVRDDEQLTLHYTAYLPWDRAESTVVAATRRAAAEDRAAGYELLLTGAGRSGDPAAVARAVQALTRLRNEQDPVRARAVTALSRLPMHLLRPDSTGVLGQVVTDAVQARDSSPQTVSALGRLAVTVLRHSVDEPALRDWSVSTLDRLFAGSLPALGRWDTVLRRGQEHVAFAAVRPWLAAGIERARYEPLFAVTAALGRRARAVPELQAMLGRAVGSARAEWVVRRAVSEWLVDPATRSERAGAVLGALDRSAIVLPEVWTTACSARTDLLDRALSGRLSGRFLERGVRWVPTPTPATSVRRWLPRQQQAYLRLLAGLVADTGSTTASRQWALRAAAEVPDGGAGLVASYLGSPDVALAEAAQGALVWTDRPAAALPVLLALLDGDRARVAAYALGRAARFAAPRRLDAELADCALGRTPAKVTSRKEALRLLVRLGAPSAGAVLRAVVDAPGQHRDVRAAAIAAARQRLDDGPMWTVLRSAASREDRLAVLAGNPYELAERHRRPYAELLVEVGRGPDPVVARAAWQALPAWTGWLPDLTADVRTRLSDLDDTRVWRAVVPAVVEQADLAEVLLALAGLDAADPTRADPTRDRPARRRLDEVVRALVDWADRNPVRDRSALAVAGRRLAAEPEFVPQAAELLLAAAHPDRADELGEVCDLVADRPLTAGRLADRLAEADLAGTAPAVARRLADRRDLAGGLFAHALTAAGRDRGWPEDWRALLADLRAYPQPDVRSTALGTATADE